MQPDEPLNQQEQDEINQLLTHGIPVGDDEEIPDYLPVSSAAELHGFLTAIVSGPEVLPPSVWLPEILEEGREPGFSAEAATRVVELAFRQMNAIANTLMEAPEDFFPLKSILPLDDGEQEILAPWCMGYVRAYQLASEAWIDVLGEPEPLEHPLSAIMLFGTGLWLDMQESLEIPENEIDSFFAWMEEKIPEDARAIHAIFLEERAPMGSPVSPMGEGFVEPVAPVRRDEPKVGRNDPCPCGSGRKYKKCCLQ